MPHNPQEPPNPLNDQRIGEPSVALSCPTWIVIALGILVLAVLVLVGLAAFLPMKMQIISLPR